MLKPARHLMPRRTSSIFIGPRRGQNFSTDDDPKEYETDVQQRQTSVRSVSGLGQTLRRQNSNIRRRGQTMQTPTMNLPRVDSTEEDEDVPIIVSKSAPFYQTTHARNDPDKSPMEEEIESGDAEDDGDDSDAESFTLKDRQQAINQTHPFGIRIWKPALYKKNRSVEKSAEGDIHSSPGGRVNRWLWLFNILWTIFFGWWLALIVGFSSITCFAFGFVSDTAAYGRLLAEVAIYLFYPFGKFVKLEQDEAYAEEDEGEGRSITEYEQWQSGDLEDGRLFFGPTNSASIVGRRRADSMESADENDSLLGHSRIGGPPDEDGTQAKARKRRLFGRGQWTPGRVLFFISFYLLIGPALLLASGICWLLVFWIPMGRITALIFYHLRRHPLALSFHSDTSYSRGPGETPSAILLCTYRAVGLKYWKYTVDGTNIFLINLMALVFFTIFDYFFLYKYLHLGSWIVHPGLLFTLGLASIIPLAYFIGQAVASISAQSSMGVGAAINAFFATVVEVFLYCIALNEGKAPLVEGSLIGSLFVGILFLPGISMCFGAVKRKTQRFNVKSAGVTSTMLLFSTIAAFGPTLFYQVYGSHELNCTACISAGADENCQRCFFSQIPAVNDKFFNDAVKPYSWFSAVLLFVSYLIGLWFTLRTHASVIWNENEEKKQPIRGPNATQQVIHTVLKKSSARDLTPFTSATTIRDSQLYKRILGQSLRQIGLDSGQNDEVPRFGTIASATSSLENSVSYLPPPKVKKDTTNFIDSLSVEQNERLGRQIAEVAATAATVATRDAFRSPKLVHAVSTASTTPQIKKPPSVPPTIIDVDEHGESNDHAGGHDAPNWSRGKSTIILLGATFLYAIIAEILVGTVDVVLENFDIDEKFLGITLFAIVPNTTEFLVSLETLLFKGLGILTWKL